MDYEFQFHRNLYNTTCLKRSKEKDEKKSFTYLPSTAFHTAKRGVCSYLHNSETQKIFNIRAATNTAAKFNGTILTADIKTKLDWFPIILAFVISRSKWWIYIRNIHNAKEERQDATLNTQINIQGDPARVERLY